MPKKLTYSHVKEQIKSFNYTLLSKEYINAHTKLKVMCDNNHKYSISWNQLRKGKRCGICNGNARYSYTYVANFIKSAGYKLMSTEYKNNDTKIEIKCDEGHIYEATFSAFKNQKQRCPICNGGIRLTYKYVKQQIERQGYRLLSKEYKNNHTNLSIRCYMGHKFDMIYNAFKDGQRCPICSAEKTSSKAEIEIQEFVKSITYGVICNDRSVIFNKSTGKNLELDIYLPYLNKAIEYNGVYWHSLDYVIKRDKIKRQQCKKLDIELLTILEEDYIIDKECELNKIREFIKEI